MVLEWDGDESVWVTHVPALNDLSTLGETREEALDQTREAIAGYLEVAAAEGIAVPDVDSAVELTEVEATLREPTAPR
ncbi:MAG TPA: type II toxin-antitoxin system HicB family antitoxin [Dehalococcoidia bacterium]|nr:type II toxin-antitoxin system HicB family antitoxin [Dehalococcoidia bacterium]